MGKCDRCMHESEHMERRCANCCRETSATIERLRANEQLQDDMLRSVMRERDEARAMASRAVSLLHMLDRAEARHPDVAEFLDGLPDIMDGA